MDCLKELTKDTKVTCYDCKTTYSLDTLTPSYFDSQYKGTNNMLSIHKNNTSKDKLIRFDCPQCGSVVLTIIDGSVYRQGKPFDPNKEIYIIGD